MLRLNMAQAKSRFSEMVSRAAGGEHILIQRRERPLAVLIGVDEFEQLERTAALGRKLALALGQSPELLEQIERGELHPVMAASGLWANDSELDDLEDEIIANRERQVGRSFDL
ncbi:MAG: type II toxin-antitoxin system prevent-host-death family antitoxin [Chloroflexi bacterium]|nr:type II toxin-antitoxin system prevent-host-death family antitoxin [Chloroflexota bacterium]